MSDYKKIILKNSPVPGAVPITDFLDFGEIALNYADHKLYYKELGGDIVVHETPNIDVEGSQNSVVKRNGDGSGIFNGIISTISDPDLYAIDASHDSGTVARIVASGTNISTQILADSGTGAQIRSTSGTGAQISSASGIGSITTSTFGTGAQISSTSGVGAQISSTSGVGAQIDSISEVGAQISSTSGVGAQISSTSGIGAQISSSSGIGAQISSTGASLDSTGLYVSADTGIGLLAEGIENLGAKISSVNDDGAEIFTLNGIYHLVLGSSDIDQQLIGISRLNSSIDWLKNNDRIGSLRTTSTISADCNWTLPDRSGTLLLDSGIRSGKTIYVDAVIGNDTRTGLSAYSYTPFATISAAVAASVAGDLIYVRAGSYSISASISLNAKGHLYFEPGTVVTIATGVTAFTYSQNSVSIYIYGYADFITAGSGTILNLSGGNTTTTLSFECNNITSVAGTGTLFSIAAGEFTLDAKLIRATGATIFSVTGTGIVTARVPLVYCGRYLNAAAAAGSMIRSDIWRLETTNSTSGIVVTSIGTIDFKIANYAHAGVGVACAWTQNTQPEDIRFSDTRWSSSANLSHITATTTAGSMSTKTIKLRGTNTFTGITNTTNSITSTQTLNVYTQNSYASTSANSNVVFKVGIFTVDTDTNNF